MYSSGFYRCIPPVFHPTTVAMVDDDEDFLAEIRSTLRDSIAAPFLDFSQILSLLRRYETPKAGDYQNVAGWLANEQRFATVSVAVIDQELQGHTGLELCRETADLPVQKLLVSGKVSDQLAVKAMSEEWFHSFLNKGDVKLWEDMEAYIQRLQYRYFHFTRPLQATEQRYYAAGLHRDRVFQRWFFNYLNSQCVIEFIRIPVGFVLVDKEGSVQLLLVRSHAEVQAMGARARDELRASDEIVELLETGQMLVHHPEDPWGDRILAVNKSDLSWRKIMYPASVVTSETSCYHVCLLPEPAPYPIKAGFSYADYLNRLDMDSTQGRPSGSSPDLPLGLI